MPRIFITVDNYTYDVTYHSEEDEIEIRDEIEKIIELSPDTIHDLDWIMHELNYESDLKIKVASITKHKGR